MNLKKILKLIFIILIITVTAVFLATIDIEQLGFAPKMFPEGSFLSYDQATIIIKSIIGVIVFLILIYLLKNFNSFAEFPFAIASNRKLIFQLSINDFRTKYAGSYLGIFWAFVQPIITVVIYWFVFEKGFHSGRVLDVPFVLWLIAGLVPWFFFSDGINGGTNALCEYQYLVKKVVFQIDILPLVKIVSSMYVNLFFIVFMLVLYSAYGYYPNVYMLQLIYYTICVIVLATAISYLTSAIVCFFKDLTQIINIILQIGIWLTPIMWNFDSMDLPGWIRILFKLNPMFYVVQGYRDSLINHIWLWQRQGMFIYFWCFTGLVMIFGTTIFRKLKVHFADVL